MKKKIVLLPILFFVIHAAVGQRQWAWMAGDQSVNINRVYGTLGVAHPSNNPGSRAGAAFWTDKQGKFYLLGGQVNDGTSGGGLLNDLWKYDPDTGWWTWIGGDKNTHSRGTYEKKGEAAAGNKPGARQNAVSWTDDNGNFWVFGGWGHFAKRDNNDDDDNDNEEPGTLNDLWTYSPASGLWNFVSGTDRKNREGKYGTRTELSQSNYPGGRYSASGWYDNNGNLWLFGGRGYSSRDDISLLDDVWKYSISDNSWAWMKGDNEGRADVTYGTKGNFDNSNTPGGRHGCISWTDNNNDFWLFGGGTQSDLFGDLWKYDKTNHQWAWISGSNSPNSTPHYTAIGVFDANVNPGARTLSAVWVDDINQIWFFGGNGYGGNTGSQPLNSLWIYSIARNQWAFMKGEVSTNPSAVYGTKGVAATDNTPGGMANSSFWKDLQGNFWVFGGRSQEGYVNQVWKLSPDCAGEISGSISPASSIICEGGSQVLTATGGTSYEWKLNNVIIPGETNDHITVTEPGTYSVMITNGTCSREASNTAVITLGTSPAGSISPATSLICEGGSQVLTATGGTSYEWKHNNIIIPGETKATLTATEPGTYSVTITNGTCSGEASNTAVIEQGTVPEGNISPATATICEGSSQVLTATGGNSYEWMRDGIIIGGETSPSLLVTIPGTYSVLIKNNGCVGQASNTSVVTLSSVAGLRYTDVIVSANTPARLSARPIGSTYEWNPVTGLNNPNAPEPMVTITESVQYTVRITPEQGCTVTDTVLVKVAAEAENKVFVPTAFTPNGNNVNDRLRPVSGLSRIHTFRVYNRWGNMVYQTNEIGAGWDGRHKGVLQPADTYTWFLTGISLNGEPVKLSGKALLIR